ncbi:MAG: cell division protein ZapA [bacterium]
MAEKDDHIRVNIFGTEYPIKGDADPAYIEEIAGYVDAKMREVSKLLSLPSMTKVAILAAMNIADELFKERAEREKTVSQLEERAAEISGWLEKELMEDAS